MSCGTRTLFVDIGGVLGTNGWDTDSRAESVKHFGLDAHDVDSRHRLMFELFETGKVSWNDYLDRVIFNEPRWFNREDFTDFVLSRSHPFPEMIDLVGEVKRRNKLTVAAVSNEGRELTEYRIGALGLCSIIDIFVCSCFVRLRKPDIDIFRLACDLSQAQPEDVLYIDDRAMFVEVAATLGIRGIVHKSVAETRAALARAGLAVERAPAAA
jgi:putative hydrolase of the HAD superfamily